jgi:general secretion pathway protein K
MMMTTMTMTTRKRKTTTKTDPSRPLQPGSRRRAARRGERGVALILVLWTFAAVAVLAAEFARAMHDEAASTRNFKESAQARMVAVAGVHEAILAMRAARYDREPEEIVDEELDPDPVRSLSHGDGQWVQASFRGHRYEVRVVDEGGKFSINKMDPQMMLVIFENLEIPDDQAEIIADSIVDWRDDDDLHQINGAETEYYEGLERPYRAKNAYFDTVEELLLVRGMTSDVFYGHDGLPGLRDIFSVFNKNKQINLNSLSPEVMIAATGMEPEDAAEFGSARRRTDRQTALEQLKTTLGAEGIGGNTRTPENMTVEARVHDASGQIVLSHVGAVLFMRRDGEGLRLYRWYDSIFDDSDSSGASAPEEAS